MVSRQKNRTYQIFNRVIIVLLVAIVVGAIIGSFYWPKEYLTEYAVIVGLLILNLLFLIGFVRRNSGQNKEKRR